jgi:hypothetical protein
MKKCSVSLAHVNSIDMNSEPHEGRVVYADMKMTTSDVSSEPTPALAQAPSTSSSDGGGEN